MFYSLTVAILFWFIQHLPAIPANECPKVQLLKQQLFMLAARKADRHASSHSHSQKPYGSLPNRPLSPPYDLSTNLPNAASSTGNDVQPEATKTVGIYHKGQNGYHHRLHKRMLPASGASQSASDPQIFHNILKQYRQLKKEDELDNIRRHEIGKMQFENDRDFRRDFDHRRPDCKQRFFLCDISVARPLFPCNLQILFYGTFLHWIACLELKVYRLLCSS